MTEVERKLWKRVEKYAPYFYFVPFLRFVGVCNSLAFGLVDEKSDIDLFIVAKKGRLFITRTVFVFLLHILGVRGHDNKFAGRFCLSFLVDETKIDLSNIALSKDIYLAFWLKKMVPILGAGYFGGIVASNAWICKYFDLPFAMSENFVVKRPYLSFIRNVFEFVFAGYVGDVLEKALRSWQIRRAKGKSLEFDDRSGFVITENILKFHHNDRRRDYSNAWDDKFGDAKIEEEKFLGIARSI